MLAVEAVAPPTGAALVAQAVQGAAGTAVTQTHLVVQVRPTPVAAAAAAAVSRIKEPLAEAVS